MAKSRDRRRAGPITPHPERRTTVSKVIASALQDLEAQLRKARAMAVVLDGLGPSDQATNLSCAIADGHYPDETCTWLHIVAADALLEALDEIERASGKLRAGEKGAA